LPKDHNTSDWVLALKHGVRKDGKPLLLMPSHEYTLLTAGDMNAIISYCSQLQPVDRELPQNELRFLGRILTDLDKIDMIPAEKIDHTRSLVASMEPEVSVEYGKYLSNSCQGCHRDNMKGGDPIAPGFPPVANISSSGNIGKWSEEQFINTLRTGLTPEGKSLDPKNMPWTMTKAYTDIELKALYKFLNTI
jgi:hypothetical protein